mmetsp:Transcript_41592/g.63464  ORF Transcript_41592/g.63464 Transcript_41592/m.63464 type:complete len:148 (+) Transcript_41592:1260-1703(+)
MDSFYKLKDTLTRDDAVIFKRDEASEEVKHLLSEVKKVTRQIRASSINLLAKSPMEVIDNLISTLQEGIGFTTEVYLTYIGQLDKLEKVITTDKETSCLPKLVEIFEIVARLDNEILMKSLSHVNISNDPHSYAQPSSENVKIQEVF